MWWAGEGVRYSTAGKALAMQDVPVMCSMYSIVTI